MVDKLLLSMVDKLLSGILMPANRTVTQARAIREDFGAQTTGSRSSRTGKGHQESREDRDSEGDRRSNRIRKSRGGKGQALYVEEPLSL